MQLRVTRPELEKFIDDKVKAGDFNSPDAVVEDALQRMMLQDCDLTADDIRAINEAEAQMDRGEAIDFNTFAAEMRKKYCAK